MEYHRLSWIIIIHHRVSSYTWCPQQRRTSISLQAAEGLAILNATKIFVKLLELMDLVAGRNPPKKPMEKITHLPSHQPVVELWLWFTSWSNPLVSWICSFTMVYHAATEFSNGRQIGQVNCQSPNSPRVKASTFPTTSWIPPESKVTVKVSSSVLKDSWNLRKTSLVGHLQRFQSQIQPVSTVGFFFQALGPRLWDFL